MILQEGIAGSVIRIVVNQLDTRLWDEARKGEFVYRPVTATFQHDSNNVQQLYFTGNDTPLEVTPEHPIYSIDRNDFVHAGSLSIGEQVKTRQGITTLEQRKQLAGTHRVYNLEVYRDHNFMVSMDSILVHNKNINLKYWSSPVSIQGKRVYRRNDLFNPDQISSWKEKGKTITGTNIDRMKTGRAPIGVDGKPVNLHHMTQGDKSAQAQYTLTPIPSGIDRSKFNQWRNSYWKERAQDF